MLLVWKISLSPRRGRSRAPQFAEGATRQNDCAVSASHLEICNKAFLYIQIHASQEEFHSLLRAARTTDHFCFDCFNHIVAYIDESDLKHRIR